MMTITLKYFFLLKVASRKSGQSLPVLIYTQQFTIAQKSADQVLYDRRTAANSQIFLEQIIEEMLRFNGFSQITEMNFSSVNFKNN